MVGSGLWPRKEIRLVRTDDARAQGKNRAPDGRDLEDEPAEALHRNPDRRGDPQGRGGARRRLRGARQLGIVGRSVLPRGGTCDKLGPPPVRRGQGLPDPHQPKNARRDRAAGRGRADRRAQPQGIRALGQRFQHHPFEKNGGGFSRESVMKKQFTLGFIAFFGFVCAAVARPAGAGVLRSCDGYSALDAAARAALATGYLEGVQAALDNETRDMLVPPDDKDHPIWWVLPRGGLTPERLERSLAVFCRSKANAKRDLAGAFLQIAARKAGLPRIGMPLDDGPSETWRAVLGASRLRCSTYLAAGDAERSYLMYGYFLGTAAARTVIKTPPVLSLMV